MAPSSLLPRPSRASRHDGAAGGPKPRRAGARGAALLLGALALAGCRKDTSCTAEVTAGQGIFRGTVAGKRARAELERDALHGACKQLCAPTAADPQVPGPAGCEARCAVDAEVGKIGKRVTCVEASSR